MMYIKFDQKLITIFATKNRETIQQFQQYNIFNKLKI